MRHPSSHAVQAPLWIVGCHCGLDPQSMPFTSWIPDQVRDDRQISRSPARAARSVSTSGNAR